MKFLDGFTEQAYALLRIVAGLLFLAHGVQKFFNFPVAFPMPLNPMLQAAGTIELVAGGLIVLGLFTRPAAFSRRSVTGSRTARKAPSRSSTAASRSCSTASSSCSSRRAAQASGARTRR